MILQKRTSYFFEYLIALQYQQIKYTQREAIKKSTTITLKHFRHTGLHPD